MQLTLEIGGRQFRVALDGGHDISVPVNFNGPQTTAFHLEKAHTRAAEVGSFLGDVRRGGSCNCEVVTFCPHANGTHTECVGHLTRVRLSVHDLLDEALLPASVVTVTPDVQPVSRFREDSVITLSAMERALTAVDKAFVRALVVRTLPNEAEKRFQSYSGTNPPYFAVDAVDAIRRLGVEHLLVDLPSLDRERDDGLLAAHRVFWGMAVSRDTTAPEPPPRGTVTELIYVASGIPDGRYLLNLQVAPFVLDAAPSRPVLFDVQPVA